MLAVNSFARHTGWLHAPVLAFAAYGVLLFALLLLAGVLIARRGSGTRTLAAAGMGLRRDAARRRGQPAGGAPVRRGPTVRRPTPACCGWRTRPGTSPFPPTTPSWPARSTAGLLLVSRRLGLVAAAAAVVMAFARVYVAAHYPWDVAGRPGASGPPWWSLGWLLLRRPLIALTGWLRSRPGVRAVFAEQPRAAAYGGVPSGVQEDLATGGGAGRA